MANGPTPEVERVPSPLYSRSPRTERIEMADYPCDLHHARYGGSSTRMYLNVYQEERVVAFRVSVCPDCRDALLAEWLDQALHKDANGRWVIPDGPIQLEQLWEARAGPAEALNGGGRR